MDVGNKQIDLKVNLLKREEFQIDENGKWVDINQVKQKWLEAKDNIDQQVSWSFNTDTVPI